MTPAKPNPPGTPDPVLGRLKEFLRRNRQILVMMLTYCAIPPVLQFILNVGPPWPQRTGVTAFTSIVGCVVAFLVFATHEYGVSTQARFRTVRKRLVWSAALGAFLMIVYFVLSADSSFTTPRHPGIRSLAGSSYAQKFKSTSTNTRGTRRPTHCTTKRTTPGRSGSHGPFR